ncbi:ABC transporter ATP-binding protein [Pseudooceanicola nitratireducens]|uniref:ABC transporter ATP-binding protein n=1 Tax=Pseudooceanicola nitratireducens TaxID=517719 RepID=UPI001C960D6C|nr:ABC transporter ATP-binding protein [Pseudooceanicola nitratireducens]MBY6158100.1 ATP-binding cassette domain-containing protein [Pseudooceanicola nitratireducens]
MTSDSAGITVQGVSYHWGAKRALDQVSFAVPRGAVCALLGPNGAGKSTLFGLLTGLFRPEAGQLVLAGHDIARATRPALAATGVVFQQPTLDLDLSVWRNMLYFAGLHGLRGQDARDRAGAALTRLSMQERAGEKVRALNGGHRRRLEIARALMHDPQVLLLDEPTVGLDAPTRAALTDQVHALARDSGISVLWATHLTDEVQAGDHLVILHQGRVLSEGPTPAVGPALTEHFLAVTAGARVATGAGAPT